MGLSGTNALFLFAILVVGIIVSVIFGVGSYLNTQIDSQFASIMTPTEYAMYSHNTAVTGAFASLRTTFIALFDFVCAMSIFMALFSSMTERFNIMNYVLNFFIGCFFSIILIYLASNMLALFIAGGGSYFDTGVIPTWLTTNFMFIMQLNVVAGLLSFAYSVFIKGGDQQNVVTYS